MKELDFVRGYPAEWRRQVGEYLRGERQVFEVRVVFRGGTEFQRAVWGEMMRIPYGEVRSYRELAEGLGRPRAYRAVANACGKNPFPIVVPCHRVVGSNGIGGFSLGLDLKRFLLGLEGVTGLRGL
jgi:O-6-methylguanine DNA methyltransferase